MRTPEQIADDLYDKCKFYREKDAKDEIVWAIEAERKKPLPQEPSLLERMAEMINCFCPCNCKFITEPNRCAKCRIIAEYEAHKTNSPDRDNKE